MVHEQLGEYGTSEALDFDDSETDQKLLELKGNIESPDESGILDTDVTSLKEQLKLKGGIELSPRLTIDEAYDALLLMIKSTPSWKHSGIMKLESSDNVIIKSYTYAVILNKANGAISVKDDNTIYRFSIVDSNDVSIPKKIHLIVLVDGKKGPEKEITEKDNIDYALNRAQTIVEENLIAKR